MRNYMLPIALLLAPMSAGASSPKAWADLQQKAERACIAASGVGRPRVSNPVIFDDRVGTVALLVTGFASRRQLGGPSVTKLCLFDRRNGRVATEEAQGWGDRP
jgi:hypothetical protein